MRTLLLMLLLSCLVMSSCRSRKKISQTITRELHEAVKTDSIAKDSVVQRAVVQAKKNTKKEQKEDQNDGQVKIVGKTDSASDFHYHNVVDGDTLSDIVIRGNAQFEIRNNWKKVQKKDAVESSTDSLNILQRVARKSVAQSTIKTVAEKIKTTEKKSTAKDLTFGAWATWLAAFIAVACLVWLFIYFKK